MLGLGLAWKTFGIVTTIILIYDIGKRILTKHKMRKVVKKVK